MGRFDVPAIETAVAPTLGVPPTGLPLARRIDRSHHGNTPAAK